MVSELVKVAYPVASAVVLLFGIFAMVVARMRFRKVGDDTQEFFLTARNSASTFRCQPCTTDSPTLYHVLTNLVPLTSGKMA